MPATTLSGVVLDHGTPPEILPYDKNCAAMTFSRLLGVGVYPTINYFVNKGWIAKGTDLQHDRVVLEVIEALDLTERHKDKKWSAVKPSLKKLADGRYFAINWGTGGSTAADAKGHAFAIIKKGGWGVYGNNSEKTGKPYHTTIHPDHKISVYGPMG